MDMAYAGKQVMFYLEIQSTDKPTDHFIIWCKIGGCFYLVNGPFVFNHFGLDACLFEFGVLHYVCQLENDRKGKTQSNVHGCKTNCPRLPAYKIYGYGNVKQHVQYFTDPENEMLAAIHFLHWRCEYFLFKIFTEIHHCHPEE